MDEEEERDREKPQIKVTDRRLFDHHGNLRETTDRVEEQAPAPPLPAEPQPTAQPPPEVAEPPVEPASPQASASPTEESPQSAADPDQDSPANLPRDFAGFVQSQYYETMLYLGAMPHPATGEVIEDLPMAQYKIDLLTMLQEKTEGNRTADESAMLDGILYQVRMAFLQKSKVVKL